jgi:undecaprenyl-diphosphatase
MSLLQSILMGILQGVTEFLPVSSSGHLALFKNIFNVNTDTGLLFDTMLHLGTLVAVCIIYWKDVVKLVVAAVQLLIDVIANIRIFFTNRSKHTEVPYRRLINSAYRKFVVLILITTIPTGIIGVAFSSLIEKASESLLVPGICLIITAILLLIADAQLPGKKKVKKTTYANAAVIGVAQGFATLPGISRSGTTITACLLLGFDRAFAVKYSFLASLPAILGANLLEFRHFDAAALANANFLYYFIGMIVAGVVGFVCIKIMIYVVRSNKFQYFAYYCAVVGIIAIIAYFVRG